jgi:DNA repair protein RadA/Sms
MSKARTIHRCRSCGATQPRWSGRCQQCGEWDTLDVELLDPPAPTVLGVGGAEVTATSLVDIDVAGETTRPTGLPELDRVLGGGLVPGSVTLLGGEPGIGKSTLLLQAMAAMVEGGARCLLVSAEESAHQVKRRAQRLGADLPELWLLAETHVAAIRAAVEETKPDVVVVDSIQTVWDNDLESAPGSLSQVRGCTQSLVGLAKTTGVAMILVGHVTKEGTLAGPRVLEHLVDTVLSFEGERYLALRLLRAVKHRFGPTGELGLFEMGEEGLEGVPDPSVLFLGDRRAGGAGSAVVPALEGHRPLLLEVQALVSPTSAPSPRRSVIGLDSGRVSMLLAVLDRRAGIPVNGADVYVSAVGGARVIEPAADLGLCLAVTSSIISRPLPADLLAVGEVGLGGEVRRVSQLQRRLSEAARLGFGTALVPTSVDSDAPLDTLRVATLADAIALALGPDAPSLAARLARARTERSSSERGGSERSGASSPHIYGRPRPGGADPRYRSRRW